MNHQRLFWKILLGFLCTFVVITQGVWVLFSLRDDRAPPPEVVSITLAPAVVEIAAQAVARGGPPAYAALLPHLPPDERGRLSLAPGPVPVATGGQIVRRVAGPDGQAYSVRFTPPRPSGWRFNIPPELTASGLVAGLAFSWFLAWYLVGPIVHLRRGFARLAIGELSVRVSPEIGARRDELADLAREFDRMASRLGQLVERRTQLLHDVSHELRSPLARLQVAIALARQNPERPDAALARIEREIERMNELIGELLTLARAEGDACAGDEYFDLLGIVDSVVADVRYEAEPLSVTVTHAAREATDETPPLRGSSELIRRAVENILRNALRFSPPGSVVAVTVGYAEPGGHYAITICDEGPGVADEAIETIFEPFVHGPGGGLGLGLAIAARAIAAHGGTVRAANRDPGGLEVVIDLPAGT